MWLTIFIGAIPTNGVGAPPPLPFEKWPVAGTGSKQRTGDERLAVLASFERGEIEAVATALQKQRDQDVHTALDNVDADDSETALILYWIAGGF